MPFSFIVAIINMLTKIKVIILHGNKLFEDKEEYLITTKDLLFKRDWYSLLT